MTPETPTATPTEERVVEVETTAIVPNAHQPRHRFDEERILRLAQSIATQGVVQPVVVRPHPSRPGQYELVAGERRLRALRLLGRRSVPAIVRRISEDALLEMALVENLQREPLTPVEEARAYRALIDTHGYTQEELAERIGKDRSTIANMMRLLSLPEAVQADLEEERMSVGHARALLGCEDPALMLRLREQVLAGELSVRGVERRIQESRRAPVGHAGGAGAQLPDSRQLSYQQARETLEQHLGTRVTIQATGDTGKLEIEFYSVDDFNRLYDALLRHG
jgi:ParB family chromosome partitioning protein